MENVSNLEKREELIMSWLNEDQKQILKNLDMTESPIEEMLYLELLKINERLKKSPHLSFSGDNANIEIETQKSFHSFWGKRDYRLDIEVVVEDLRLPLSTGYVTHKFAIECDGHDFHEKTKEQAANDRRRERVLMINGYHVIRFTGSEIFDNAKACASEAFEIIERRVKECRFIVD